MAQSRYWCFTYNNPAAEPTWEPEWMEYLVYAGEMTEALTPHWQGYVQLKRAQRLSKLRTWLPGAHFEIQRGTNEEGMEYVKKGDTDSSLCLQGFKEFGVFKPTGGVQGARSDLNTIIEQIRTNQPREEYMFTPSYVRYWTGLERIKYLNTQPYMHDDVRGFWYVGPPGTGKSHKAYSENPDAYRKSQNKWWDGYDNHETVILDDLDDQGKCLGHYLKIWTDKYPCQGEVKGTTCQLRHKKFIVTSNYTIERLWGDQEEMMFALLRRFKVTVFSDFFIRK